MIVDHNDCCVLLSLKDWRFNLVTIASINALMHLLSIAINACQVGMHSAPINHVNLALWNGWRSYMALVLIYLRPDCVREPWQTMVSVSHILSNKSMKAKYERKWQQWLRRVITWVVYTHIYILEDIILIHNMFEFDSKYGMTQENMWTYPIGTLLKCFACIENVFNDDCFGICVQIKK